MNAEAAKETFDNYWVSAVDVFTSELSGWFNESSVEQKEKFLSALGYWCNNADLVKEAPRTAETRRKFATRLTEWLQWQYPQRSGTGGEETRLVHSMFDIFSESMDGLVSTEEMGEKLISVTKPRPVNTSNVVDTLRSKLKLVRN